MPIVQMPAGPDGPICATCSLTGAKLEMVGDLERVTCGGIIFERVGDIHKWTHKGGNQRRSKVAAKRLRRAVYDEMRVFS